jgi:hypothetical protein
MLAAVPVFGAGGIAVNYPEQHPYLMVTAEELAAARERAAGGGWAREALDRILSDADGVLSEPPEIPEGVHEAHRRVARSAQTVGLAYGLSGDGRYRDYVWSILMHYAKLYPTLPLKSRGRTRLTAASSLYETGWYIPLLYAYDFVCEDLSVEERAKIEAGVVRPGLDCFLVEDYDTDPRTTDWHYRCYNFQAWHLAAVGLAGFLLRDNALVDYAIESQFGFRHQVGHDIADDGMFWERSAGYHFYTLSALMALTEGAWRCGIDLYNLESPDTYGPSDPVRELNYPVDGDNGPKTLKLMFDAPFYLAFPDGSLPTISDSNMSSLQGGDPYRIAFARYGDPKYGWLVNERGGRPGLQALIHGEPEGSFPRPEIGTGAFANNGRAELGSTLFPSIGLGLLRADEADENATCALLNYGPQGGGHGHPDMLSVVLYARGKQWIPDFGSFDYAQQRMKSEWTAQTVSHSTAVVDGRSHLPQKGDAMWVSDNIAEPVFGDLVTFQAMSLARIVRARSERAVPDVMLDRTLVAFDRFVVDFFLVDGGLRAHSVDWVIHVDGQASGTSVESEAKSGALGSSFGYQHVAVRDEGWADRSWWATWGDTEGRTLRMTMAGEPGTAVIRAQSPMNRSDRSAATLVARREAEKTLFASAFDPRGGEDTTVRFLTARAGNRSVPAERATGVVVETDDGTRFTALWTDGGGPYQVGDVKVQGTVTVVREQDGSIEAAGAGPGWVEVGGQRRDF